MKQILAMILLFIAFEAKAYTDDDKAFIKSEWGVDVDSTKLQNHDSEIKDEQDTIAWELDCSTTFNDYSYMALRADSAIENWVNLVAFLLTKRGRADDARQLQHDYQSLYANRIVDLSYMGFAAGDLENHDPFSLWLELAYQMALAAIGQRTMELLHLDDIHEVNYSIPVTFQPKGDKRKEPVQYWSKDEYIEDTSKYFAGPVTYWTVYLICTGATYGTAAVFACTPVGMLSEMVVANRIAPPIAKKIYERANP